MKQLFDLVEVTWDDAAAHDTGWSDVVSVKPQLVLSVGYLIYMDKRHLVLAMDIDEEGGHNGRSQIPKGMVQDFKILRKKTA